MRRVWFGKMLKTIQVIQMIDKAIRKKKAFCLVRVGDGENIVLAQRYVMPISRVIKTRWGRRSRTTNSKGIRLPHEQARKRLIKAIKAAELVGIPFYQDNELRAPQKYLRPLTNRCFRVYRIRPKKVCHTLVNRHLVEHKSFWEMLRGRRVALVSRWAEPFANLLEQEYGDFNIRVVAKIPMTHFDEIEKVFKKMKKVDCDIVLISAGVNAAILAEKLAHEQGRVAIDFGKTSMFMVKHRGDRIRPWRGDCT